MKSGGKAFGEKKRSNSYSMKNRRMTKRVTSRNERRWEGGGFPFFRLAAEELKLRVLTSTEMFHFPSPIPPPLPPTVPSHPSLFVFPFRSFPFLPSICGISRNITLGAFVSSEFFLLSPRRDSFHFSVLPFFDSLFTSVLPVTRQDPRIARPINRLKTD